MRREGPSQTLKGQALTLLGIEKKMAGGTLAIGRPEENSTPGTEVGERYKKRLWFSELKRFVPEEMHLDLAVK